MQTWAQTLGFSSIMPSSLNADTVNLVNPVFLLLLFFERSYYTDGHELSILLPHPSAGTAVLVAMLL